MDPPPIDRSPLTALFNLDYRLAELRARAGHPGYARWAAHRIDHAFDPPSLPPLEESAARLALLPAESRYRRHARGTSAMAVATAARAHEHWRDEALDTWLTLARQLDAADFLESLGPSVLTPIEAYAAAAAGPCTISNVRDGYSFDEFEVTTCWLVFDVNRPIDHFPKRLDPRMWDVGARGSFEEADKIAESERVTRIPGAVEPPPPPVLPLEADEIADAGNPWPGPGPLYENAVTSVDGVELADFKNILTIDFTVTDDQVSVDYSLSEALSLELGGSGTLAGGLDRDSGRAWVVKTGESSVQVTAIKSVRIAQPSDRRDLLNSNMAGALPFWFMNLVFLGVCENVGG